MTAFPGREGLQPERTALAWQRTAITATVIMLPLILVNARQGLWVMTALGSVASTAGVVLVLQVRHRFRQLWQDDRSFSPLDPMRMVAGVTALTAFIGVVTAVFLFQR